KQVAEDVDLALQFLIRNRLDESLRGCGRLMVEFRQLCGRGTSGTQGFALSDHLAHETDLLGLRRIEAAPGEQQIAHDCIADIALQTRDSTESGNQTQAQFREGKAGRFVGDDEIASEGQFESSAKRYAV